MLYDRITLMNWSKFTVPWQRKLARLTFGRQPCNAKQRRDTHLVQHVCFFHHLHDLLLGKDVAVL